MKKLLQTSFLFVLLGVSACSIGSNSTMNKCEAFYIEVMNNEAVNIAERANTLETKGSSCLKYEKYNVWLAFAYQGAKDYPKSVEVARNALKTATEHRANLLQVIAEAELQTGSMDKAFKQAEEISRQFPNYAPILAMLAEISAKKGDFNAAFNYSKHGYNLEKSAAFLIAMGADLHQLHKDEEAVNTIYRALEMEPYRVGNLPGVLEAIFSLVNLNRRGEAADLAKRHIAANPNWRNNSTFARAAFELGATNEPSPVPND